MKNTTIWLHIMTFSLVLCSSSTRAFASCSLAFSSSRTHGRTALFSSTTDNKKPSLSDDVPVYSAQGIFAVNKPLEWTSSDVVSYIRGMLRRDTEKRGGRVAKIGRKSKRAMKVGHGGTLDPLATGVLVIGVGSGTKEMQSYLSGQKAYRARGEFGFETTTLDMDANGNVTKRASFDHITVKSIQEVLPSFTGKIQQVPPVFSALKKGGKKMYDEARKGKTAEDMGIQAREVDISRLELIDTDDSSLPSFDIDMECGGGTYVRSLIRDIAYHLNSVATTTVLTRTKQGQFTLDDVLEKDDWSPENVYAAIEKANALRQEQES